MSRPKVWAQSDGDTTIVHTPFTTRAKELMDLYNGLRLPLLTVDERLDVLLHVKWTGRISHTAVFTFLGYISSKQNLLIKR